MAALVEPSLSNNSSNSSKSTTGTENPQAPDNVDRRSQQRSDRRRNSRPLLLAPESRHSDDPEDALGAYQRLIVVSRWCALLVSAVALGTANTDRSFRDVLVFAALGLLTTYRTVRPIRHLGFELGLAASIVAELAILVLSISTTGHWRSPLAFLLIPAVMVGAFSQDGPLVVGYGVMPSLLISILEISERGFTTSEQWQTSWQWTIQIVAFTIVAGVGRRIVHDSLARHTKALDNMNRLTSANSLLFALHKVAQSLPASLDLEDVLQSTIANARDLFPNEAITVLIRDETTNTWEVSRTEGARLPKVFSSLDLPDAVSTATRSTGPIRTRDLAATHRTGFLPGTKSGLYAPLRSRQHSFGVLAIEHTEEGLDTDESMELLKRFAEPASVAIDNARWFGRIRRVAADEERVRIARDLHDRIGQSLAYLGFELDRLARLPEAAAVTDEVKRLRGDVGRVVSEVRETLYDIRTDVTVDRSGLDTLQEFLDRVQTRNPDLAIEFTHDVSGTLPSRQEREMWLIAQEAIVNVERHARASTLTVHWTTNGQTAELTVSDNGRGFSGASGRVDSYGLKGLQERAAAIGARIEITSSHDKGTCITCRLD
jgi:signal transduction histidine kinase